MRGFSRKGKVSLPESPGDSHKLEKLADIFRKNGYANFIIEGDEIVFTLNPKGSDPFKTVINKRTGEEVCVGNNGMPSTIDPNLMRDLSIFEEGIQFS